MWHLLDEEVPAVFGGVQDACSLDSGPHIVAEALLLLLWQSQRLCEDKIHSDADAFRLGPA